MEKIDTAAIVIANTQTSNEHLTFRLHQGRDKKTRRDLDWLFKLYLPPPPAKGVDIFDLGILGSSPVQVLTFNFECTRDKIRRLM